MLWVIVDKLLLRENKEEEIDISEVGLLIRRMLGKLRV